MKELDVATAVRNFAAERRYQPATVTRWLCLPAADTAALFALATELRPSEHQLRDLWAWAEEIAGRDGCSLASVFDSPVIAAARHRTAGRNDRLRFVKHALRRWRFPQLAAAEECLAALVRRLALPGHVRLTLPEFLEGDTVRIEITARDVADLRAAAQALLNATERPECAALFAMLDEAP